MDKNILKCKLFTLAPEGRESNCSSATSYSCERGVGKDADRATWCAMTSVGVEDKITTNNLAASPKTNHSPLTTHNSLKRKTAFTLAEVLITLGIIGIVAALTLPSVINNYKQKQLHTAFLRSSSMIQNALNQTASEYGYTNYKELNSICGNLGKTDAFATCKRENNVLFKEISSDFLSKFKGLRQMSSIQVFHLKKDVTNYSGLYKFNYSSLYGVDGWGGGQPNSVYLTSDGALISSIDFFHHEASDGLSISFDTNGPYKGPNRYGYDIFLFNTGTWYKFCSQKSDGIHGLYNGRGCYDYALKDINPDDKTKKYWDSLVF